MNIDDLSNIVGVQLIHAKGLDPQVTLKIKGKSEYGYGVNVEKDIKYLDELLTEMLEQNDDRLIHGLCVALESYLKK